MRVLAEQKERAFREEDEQKKKYLHFSCPRCAALTVCRFARIQAGLRKYHEGVKALEAKLRIKNEMLVQKEAELQALTEKETTYAA